MIRGRLAPLGAALALAAGFVVLRVAYRIVFGGAGGGGEILLDLPRIPLAGPFAHLALFGPVTTGGLAASVAGALPFAALVLATGLLAAVLDVRALLGRAAARGPIRVVARALLVALATFPALVEAVRRARLARDLRGGRSAAGIIVPVLARTVERATAIGASMEVRGFAASPAARASAPRDPAGRRDLVRARGVEVRREDRLVLAVPEADVQPGDVVVVTGPTGSGKSTLLGMIDGLVGHRGDAQVAGELEVAGLDRVATPPRETARRVGSVPQDARAAFVAATVAEEIGFALAVRGLPASEIRERVDSVARRVGVAALLSRDILALSAGEASRVALAAALVGEPELLLVDEPLADLDADARDAVLGVLAALARDGGAVVVAEHRVGALAGVASRRWTLADGRLLPGDPAPEHPRTLPRAPGAAGAVAARIRGLRAGYGGEPVVRGADLDLRRGEVVAITGPNGAGKSTLLREIARTRTRGVVEVAGRDVAALAPRARRRRVALVPDRPDDLFVRSSVAEECAGADRALSTRALRVRGATLHLATQLARVTRADVAGFLARHPRDLSVGQRLCLALALQAAAEPDVLLVDEPVRGLDPDARALVAEAVARLAGAGSAVVLATHDAAFADAVAHRALRLVDGRLTEARPDARTPGRRHPDRERLP